MRRSTIHRTLTHGVAPVALAGLLVVPGLGRASAARRATPMPEIAATAKNFATVPAQIPAGMVRVTFTNDGGTWQGVGIAQLKPGVGQTAFTAVLKTGDYDKLDPLAVPYGGAGAGRGATETVAPPLPAGRYALFDTEQGPKGKTLYIAKYFSVSGTAMGGAAAPNTTAAITLKDMKFDAPSTLSAGTHTIKIYNAGPSEHMMVTAKIAKGKTYQDILAYLKQGPNAKGQPPIDPTSFGGLNTMGPGQTAYLTQTFTPGTYVMLCFVTDAKKHIPHVAEGMVSKITVS